MADPIPLKLHLKTKAENISRIKTEISLLIMMLHQDFKELALLVYQQLKIKQLVKVLTISKYLKEDNCLLAQVVDQKLHRVNIQPCKMDQTPTLK